VSAESCVEVMVSSRPPNSLKTSLGAATGWATAPWSIVPYVAKASLVAGVHTGSETSAASAHLPVAAPTWKRAVPGFAAAAAKRTSTRSCAGTVTRWPAASTLALAARPATLTERASPVWFCRTTGSSKRSPKLRKRGAEGRTMRGRRAVIVSSPAPNSLPPATAIAITR
jgi:hypothetical protein